VQEEELDHPVAQAPRVVPPGHAQRLQLVAAAGGLVVVIPEHPANAEPGAPRPAEALLPVHAELRRAAQIVVVAESYEHVRGVPRLVALHSEAERQLSRAADAVITRREERNPRLRCGRAAQRKGKDAQNQNPAQTGFLARSSVLEIPNT